MEIRDEYIVILAVLLLLAGGYTYYNIHTFMPVEKKCESGFDIINRCGCIPDEHYAEMFNQISFHVDLNTSEIMRQYATGELDEVNATR